MSHNTDEISRMRERMDNDDGSMADIWDPQPDQQLVGEVLEFRDAETRFGPCQIAIIEEDQTGDVFSVFLSRSVLKNEFERQAPRVGDVVGIKYFGLKPTRDGKSEFHLYKLRVVRKPGSGSANPYMAAVEQAPREPVVPAVQPRMPAGRPMTDDDPPF